MKPETLADHDHAAPTRTCRRIVHALILCCRDCSDFFCYIESPQVYVIIIFMSCMYGIAVSIPENLHDHVPKLAARDTPGAAESMRTNASTPERLALSEQMQDAILPSERFSPCKGGRNKAASKKVRRHHPSFFLEVSRFHDVSVEFQLPCVTYHASNYTVNETQEAMPRRH